MKKTVMFDMDGVLFNSMPVHAGIWEQIFAEEGIVVSPEEIYMIEGMTGTETVRFIFRSYLGVELSDEKVREIYCRKSAAVTAQGPMPVMEGAVSAVRKVVSCGVTPIVVTGSTQESIMSGINVHFPNLFDLDLTVCGNDVKKCKPDPEPYLTGLRKAGDLLPEESLVIENAPMGVRSGKAAGCAVLAVNTGPLADKVLKDAGADAVFPSMTVLAEEIANWL